MNKQIVKQQKKAQRKGRVRAKVFGTPERPRLAVFRSAKHITVQLIDDTAGNTLLSVSDSEIKAKGNKTEQAAAVGKAVAKKAQDKKIATVVFDRAGNKYHGRVKALADAAREGGLEF